MFDQIFGKTNTQFASALNAGQEFGRLSVDTLEKLTSFQLERSQAYTNFGLEQLRAVLGVQDAKGLQDFVLTRGQAAQELGQQLQGDVKTLTELNQRFGEQAQQLVRQQLTPAQGKKAA